MDGLAFVADERVEIHQPETNATVSLPLEVSWTVDEYDGYFALFFDRSPIRPGQSLRSLVPDDDPCRHDATCPDDEWLAQRHVYVTQATRLVVGQLPDLRENRHSKDHHDVTVVLLDAKGERQGESAWVREFVVARDD